MTNNTFEVSEFSEKILRDGGIISVGEKPFDMVNRITQGLEEVDGIYAGEDSVKEHSSKMGVYIGTKKVVPNTAIMTNLGRHNDKPLSACTVPDVDLQGDLDKLQNQVDEIHLSGMGTGYDFTGLDNPMKILYFLNDTGVSLQESGNQERPVGNMGIMSIYDKYIEDFISVKEGADERGEKWNFNLSVSIDDNFIQAVENNEDIELSDGSKINANILFDRIAKSAYNCADPGILFMDKMQKGNTTPSVGKYVSVAPCGETGLTKGETCNFASLNLVEFLDSKGNIDYTELKKVVVELVRYLDNIVEYNLDKYSDQTSENVMRQKRKIGVGVCGVADMFLKMGITYGAAESIKLSEDIMSFINFTSKEASMNLARERGSFGAFEDSLYQGKYLTDNYGQKDTNTISKSDWLKLEKDIKNNGLRNCNTVILPPTGRSALVFDTSQQIEPLFNIKQPNGKLPDTLVNEGLSEELLGEIKKSGSLENTLDSTNKAHLRILKLYRTANEINLKNHLDILEAFSQYTDEAVSKTINLPNNTTVEKIKEIYLDCHRRGLKGVTVYRDGSKKFQPIKTS